MRTRIIALLIIALVLLVGGSYVLNSVNKRSLTVTIPAEREGYSVGIYKAAGKSESTAPSNFINEKNLIKEFTSTTKLKLSSGHYVIANKQSDDYAQQIEQIDISDQPLEVKMNADYSDMKLSKLLTLDRESIHRVVVAAQPTATGYDFVSEKLYQNGDWYGAVLSVKQTPEQARLNYVDKYHLVAHKSNGVWSLVTTPELVLSKQTYPDIPVDVLREVNKL